MTDRIEKSIDLNAPIERVWRALTDREEFGQWFRVNLENGFKLGEVTRGQITYPGYEHLIWKATTVKMDEPRIFAFTWLPYAVDPDRDYSQETPTLVEFRLTSTPSGTHLTVTESGFDKLPEDRRAEAFRMNEGGWAQQVLNIKSHVKS